MTIASFETPDGDDIEVDSDEVVSVRRGDDDETTVIEMDDATELTVVASVLEVVADLGLDPLDVLDGDLDDDMLDEDAEEQDD